MKTITVSYSALGEKFSPMVAESKSGIRFDTKIEPGDIGKIGRYRGRPTPHGYGEKMWPNNEVSLVSLNTEFFATISLLNSAAESAGADDREIHLLIKYGTQCNFEFSPDVVRSLALLELTVTVTCYSDPEEEAKDLGDWKDLEQDS